MATSTIDSSNHPRRFSNQAVVWTIVGIVVLLLVIAFAAKNSSVNTTERGNGVGTTQSESMNNAGPNGATTNPNTGMSNETNSMSTNPNGTPNADTNGAYNSGSTSTGNTSENTTGGSTDNNVHTENYSAQPGDTTTNPSPGPTTRGTGPNSSAPANPSSQR